MKLFTPLTVRNMTLKNRIVMAPMQLAMGFNNQRVRDYYLERAKGGVGAIIMHATAVDLFVEDAAWGRPGGVKKFMANMTSFTEAVRAAGARIGIQLWHGNQLPAGSGVPNLPESKQVAPSAKDGMVEMSREEIRTITRKFVLASENAKTAGFDFIDLHGAHGYLLCQFFSGADNKRTDAYGGDVRKRMRFGLDVVKAVREGVGDTFPVFYRIGAEEPREGGVTKKQGVLFAVELEKAGVDVMDVSVGGGTGLSASPSKKAVMGTFAHLSTSIKEKVNIPVIAVGRINTGEVAESILTQEKADLVAIGRQLLADPFWPEKVRDGQTDDLVACESCNTCFGPLMGGKWKPGDSVCKVNPRAGKESEMPL